MYLRVTGNFFKLSTLDLCRKEADIDESILLRFRFTARSLQRTRPVIEQCSCPTVMRVDPMVWTEAERRTRTQTQNTILKPRIFARKYRARRGSPRLNLLRFACSIFSVIFHCLISRHFFEPHILGFRMSQDIQISSLSLNIFVNINIDLYHVL